MKTVMGTFLISLLPTLASAAPFTFIVAGLGGEPEYEQRFREQATAIAEAAEKAAGAPGHVVVLTGDEARRDAVRLRHVGPGLADRALLRRLVVGVEGDLDVAEQGH